jgi:hypothetical protein
MYRIFTKKGKQNRNYGRLSIHDKKSRNICIFHPMLKHGKFMNKSGSPFSKGWPDILENPSIPLFPNAPTC